MNCPTCTVPMTHLPLLYWCPQCGTIASEFDHPIFFAGGIVPDWTRQMMWVAKCDDGLPKVLRQMHQVHLAKAPGETGGTTS